MNNQVFIQTSMKKFLICLKVSFSFSTPQKKETLLLIGGFGVCWHAQGQSVGLINNLNFDLHHLPLQPKNIFLKMQKSSDME